MSCTNPRQLRYTNLQFSLFVFLFIPALHEALGAAREFAPCRQHPPSASLADHADIRADPVNAPCITATWMSLAHLYDIADV